MFFYISKVFWLLAQPLSIMLVLLVVGMVLVFLRRRRLGLGCLGIGAAFIFLVGFTSLGAIMIAPLENRFPRPQLPEEVSSILILGGATNSRIGSARGVTELNSAGDRMTEAVWLAGLYPEARIVFTGGDGALLPQGESEAQSAKRLLEMLGIAPERLVLEDQSRNTAENAEFTAAMLQGEGSVVLVTSAFHMPRSVGLYRAQGIAVVPWPTDYRSTGEDWFGVDIANPVLNLEVFGIAMREWIGLAAYHWSGRTPELLPGP